MIESKQWKEVRPNHEGVTNWTLEKKYMTNAWDLNKKV